MQRPRRWDPCVSHRGNDVTQFIETYFSEKDRRVLLIAGAGFDPRATRVAHQLGTACKSIRAVWLKEERPKPAGALVSAADANLATLDAAIKDASVQSIDIFRQDGAVVGGRNVVTALHKQDFNALTDVVVDLSALSVGTAFPAVRYLVERIEAGNGLPNLHLFVTHDPDLDATIKSVAGDQPSYVHGFKGGSTLDETTKAAKLWLPQLAAGRRNALGRLFAFVEPHDTCPILPFPARDPRMGDRLTEEFLTEFENAWSVDARNIVYANESDPLDLYRTILRLDDLRSPVFDEVGGSLLVLSPVGSKVTALGALMAALERDLPVAYLESIGYDWAGEKGAATAAELIHVWLEGDVYPSPRPPLQRQGAKSV